MRPDPDIGEQVLFDRVSVLVHQIGLEQQAGGGIRQQVVAVTIGVVGSHDDQLRGAIGETPLLAQTQAVILIQHLDAFGQHARETGIAGTPEPPPGSVRQITPDLLRRG